LVYTTPLLEAPDRPTGGRHDPPDGVPPATLAQPDWDWQGTTWRSRRSNAVHETHFAVNPPGPLHLTA
jgi:hypothetical protein